MKNYVELKAWGLLFKHFVYIDTEWYLADNIFIQEKLRVRFGREGRKQGSPYRIIFCKVRKRDAKKFVRSMERLYNKMLLMGYADADKCLEELGGIFKFPQSFQL